MTISRNLAGFLLVLHGIIKLQLKRYVIITAIIAVKGQQTSEGRDKPSGGTELTLVTGSLGDAFEPN